LIEQRREVGKQQNASAIIHGDFEVDGILARE